MLWPLKHTLHIHKTYCPCKNVYVCIRYHIKGNHNLNSSHFKPLCSGRDFLLAWLHFVSITFFHVQLQLYINYIYINITHQNSVPTPEAPNICISALLTAAYTLFPSLPCCIFRSSIKTLNILPITFTHPEVCWYNFNSMHHKHLLIELIQNVCVALTIIL